MSGTSLPWKKGYFLNTIYASITPKLHMSMLKS